MDYRGGEAQVCAKRSSKRVNGLWRERSPSMCQEELEGNVGKREKVEGEMFVLLLLILLLYVTRLSCFYGKSEFRTNKKIIFAAQ